MRAQARAPVRCGRRSVAGAGQVRAQGQDQAAGRSNQRIASALFLSPKTVRNNVSNVFAKLQVADRAEEIVRAREAGLGR